MAYDQSVNCGEYDAVHGSSHGNHICSCNSRAQHGGPHDCPKCNRRWGHPDWSSRQLKKTPKGI